MPSEHEPLGGADLTCPRCKYMTVRWLSDLQIYSCFRLGCGWEGVDPTNPAPLATQMRQQHERELAALRAERDELAQDILLVQRGCLTYGNDGKVLSECAEPLFGRCSREVLAQLDELQATVAVLREALAWYADGENYRARLCEKTSSGDYEVLSPVDADHGQKARKALGGGDEALFTGRVGDKETDGTV
jgi:hypothetical protein